ncbi:V-type ATPase subunit [Aminiphilus sp.]|uniref:V-type ATPase subunit n=1 Tax=Aminiphilus sp. TaxID=1872488 RepID=UPI00260FBA00|nr:V-type ATPase subunit [Aminiphilus sp.]
MARAGRYEYTIARLRAMERRLVEESTLLRILDAEDLASALKMLSETGYASWLPEMKSDVDFDSLIEKELLFIYDQLRQFVPDKELLLLFRLPYDFHNVKVVLKSLFRQRRGQPRRWDLLTSLGSIPGDDLVTAIESEDYRTLPFGLAQLLPGCVAHWEQTQDLLEIERRLDRQLFKVMDEQVGKLELVGVAAWFKGRVDAENLRTILRLRRFGFDQSLVEQFVHDGGAISRERVLSLYAEPFEGWGRSVAYADVSRVFREIENFEDPGTFLVELEKGLDEFITWLLGKSAYLPFAPENVLRYLWLKEMETRNLRILLVSKASGMDRDVVRGLMRRDVA